MRAVQKRRRLGEPAKSTRQEEGRDGKRKCHGKVSLTLPRLKLEATWRSPTERWGKSTAVCAELWGREEEQGLCFLLCVYFICLIYMVILATKKVRQGKNWASLEAQQ